MYLPTAVRCECGRKTFRVYLHHTSCCTSDDFILCTKILQNDEYDFSITVMFTRRP